MYLLLAFILSIAIPSSMARQKATCMTKEGIKIIINSDHSTWLPGKYQIDYCDFEGTFVFYSMSNYQVCLCMNGTLAMI